MASYFEKDHKNVLRDLRELHCSPEFRRLNFEPFKINDLTGESTSHVMMTKDGFMFLVMGFTGPEAAPFKEGYIERFNAMEDELRRLQDQPLALPAPDEAMMPVSVVRSILAEQMQAFREMRARDESGRSSFRPALRLPLVRPYDDPGPLNHRHHHGIKGVLEV